MANVDMLKLIRAAYVGKQGFDVHHSSRHSEQTSFPDQLKGAWFCLQKEFFKNAQRKDVECYPLDNKGIAKGVLPSNLINIDDKGKKKIKLTFNEKLYDCFPDLRHEYGISNISIKPPVTGEPRKMIDISSLKIH